MLWLSNFGAVVQWQETLVKKPDSVGSTPIGTTKFSLAILTRFKQNLECLKCS